MNVSTTIKTFSTDSGKHSYQYYLHSNSQSVFEDEEITRQRWWYPFIMPRDVVFDIGSSFGSYTLAALALGAYVITFSPQREYEVLKENIELNGFTRVRLYNFGLYSRAGYITGYIPTYSESYPVNFKPFNQDDTVIPVRVLDSLIPELRRFIKNKKVRIMKLDTEGNELEILKGSTKTLRKYKPEYILVENHTFKDKHAEDNVKDFLANSYEMVSTVPYSSVSHSLYKIK